MARICVYTVMMGDYESLNEQPISYETDIPFICFTDNPTLISSTWEIRTVTPIFPGDPIRSQRYLKTMAHRVIPDYDISIYIDNTVLLKRTPGEILKCIDLSSGICIPLHSFRNSVGDEYLEVFKLRLDDPIRIAEQLAHARDAFPEILDEKPFWAGIIIRSHHNESVVRAMELWSLLICRYTRRDQLSLNLALKMTKLQPNTLSVDNCNSSFHTWPHSHNRNHKRREWQGIPDTHSISPEISNVETELLTGMKNSADLDGFLGKHGRLYFTRILAELLHLNAKLVEDNLTRLLGDRDSIRKELDIALRDGDSMRKDLDTVNRKLEISRGETQRARSELIQLKASTSWKMAYFLHVFALNVKNLRARISGF